MFVLINPIVSRTKRREEIMVPVREEDMKKIQEVQKQIDALESQPKHRDTLYMGLYHDLARIKSGFVRDYILHTLPLQIPGLASDHQKDEKSLYAQRSLPSVHLNHDKCLFFAHHAVMIETITKAFEELGLQEDVDFVVVTGKTLPQKRQPKVSYFQNDRKCRFAILGIRSAGSGLQMSNASLVIFTELDFEPGRLAQAESRAHRRGATKDVLVLYILAKGTLDENILRTIIKKEATAGELCDGKVRVFRSDAKQVVEVVEDQTAAKVDE